MYFLIRVRKTITVLIPDCHPPVARLQRVTTKLRVCNAIDSDPTTLLIKKYYLKQTVFYYIFALTFVH